jgi:pimeloyl-ACP methyl ester carboxylesterase
MARSESRRVFATPVGQLACRVRPGSSRKALLTLRDIGHPAELPHVCPVDAIGIAPDLPGHGASGDWPTENLNASDLADALTYVLASLPIEHTEVSGDGGSAVLALMVAERLRARCVAVTISRPLPLDASERDRFLAGLPDPAPRGSGAHLLETWNWVRHKALFPPWAPPDAAHAERVSAPAPTRVHAEVVEVLRAGSAFGALWRSVLAEDLNAWLARVPAQVLPADSAGHQALLSRLTS